MWLADRVQKSGVMTPYATTLTLTKDRIVYIQVACYMCTCFYGEERQVSKLTGTAQPVRPEYQAAEPRLAASTDNEGITSSRAKTPSGKL